ncbi:hypothetical protein PoB_007473200 [Plakobranchus ocellatus]|uniref:Uncharacterized protein n=1 Tax=Plakobranchus ocellatus TaxID=259542 RepID=A0AAV4DV97_9GAST|nr:hypothetical protein PoB_007473200 [Plakobranchus ocellatus]
MLHDRGRGASKLAADRQQMWRLRRGRARTITQRLSLSLPLTSTTTLTEPQLGRAVFSDDRRSGQGAGCPSDGQRPVKPTRQAANNPTVTIVHTATETSSVLIHVLRKSYSGGQLGTRVGT